MSNPAIPLVRGRFSTARSPFRPSGVSRTRSEFRDDCDIRTIIQRHSLTPPCTPRYVDMSIIPDGVQGVLEFARSIAADFDSLPLKAREKFNYDSNALVTFLLDERNRDEAIGLGLLPPKAPASTPPTPPTPPKSE